VTYFGPGTLMSYPIIHLPQNKIKLRDYVDMLEDVMISTCAEYGVGVEGR
jgi:lipoate-protein ligase B